jgi:hypothetical protein
MLVFFKDIFMKLNLFIISIASLLIIGCTGTEIKIRPENTLYTQAAVEPYVSVGVKDISSSPTLPQAGNMTEAFSNEIKKSKFAKEVYYPARPDDKAEIVLESQFNVALDPHSGSAFAKSFFTGLTLFIIEPLFWYDFDYKFSGTVDVLKNGKVIKQVSAVTDATLSVKWLSLGSVTTLEGEALAKAKKTLFQQLLYDIGK